MGIELYIWRKFILGFEFNQKKWAPKREHQGKI